MKSQRCQSAMFTTLPTIPDSCASGARYVSLDECLSELDTAISKMNADSHAKEAAQLMYKRLRNWKMDQLELHEDEILEITKATTMLVQSPLASADFYKRSEEFSATLSKINLRGVGGVFVGIGMLLLTLLSIAAIVVASMATAGILPIMSVAIAPVVLGFTAVFGTAFAGTSALCGVGTFISSHKRFSMASDMRNLGNALQHDNENVTKTTVSPKQ